MSSPSLLIAGATGYIAGTFLTTFHDAHPSIPVRCIVRDDSQAALVTNLYSSNVTPVVGSLSDAAFLQKEAAKAFIVVNGTGENGDAVQALIEGLAKNPLNNATKASERPVFIHISGTSLVTYKVLGESSPHISNDLTEYDELMGLDETHRQVKNDNIVRRVSKEANVRSLILSPPTILGRGTGPGKKETVQVHWYDAIVEAGAPFLLGKGENIWSVVSVRDLGKAILFFVDLVLEGSEKLEFGDRGYYFIEAFEASLMDRAKAIGKRLVSEGKIKTADVQLLSEEEITKKHGPFFSYLLGSSSRVRADRLRSLGWQPTELDWKALVEEHGGHRC
jgi:nucleoside-diphosphate-sugar epimerase